LTVFLDSSALVKLYVPELGHEHIRNLPDAVVVSHLARVEVPSAFWRKHRDGDIGAPDAAALSAEFESDFLGTDVEAPRFAYVRLDDPALARAAAFVAVHRLRSFDAIHLACAVLARGVDATCRRFGAFDTALRAAAAAEGFELVPRD
jgi:predicted nucleic acid-binding protein